MNTAARQTSPLSAPTLSPLRLQAAVVRALLDELEEHAPIEGGDAALVEQLAEELARLGRDALRTAAALNRAVPAPSRATHREKEEDEVDPIPHWLPLVAF